MTTANHPAPVNRVAYSALGYRRSVFVLACLLVSAVFPLIFVGAGVTSKNAGMAFPDGFTSNGYLLRNPPGWFDADDTRWEHGHRLIGRAVGILAIVLAVVAWRMKGMARTVSLCTLGAIVVQGVLGAYRVNEVSTLLALVHGVFGQVCFCLACAGALLMSRAWIEHGQPTEVAAVRTLQRLAVAAAATVFIQIVLGAAFRHFHSDAALAGHILWAIATAVLLGWLALWVMGQHPSGHPMSALGCMAAMLTLVQLVLGGVVLIVTVLRVPAVSVVEWLAPTAHTAVGAMLFANLVLLAMCSYRMLGPLDASSARSGDGLAVAS